MTGEMAIGRVDPRSCKVFTCFSVAAYATGGSSIATVRRLIESGIEVRHIDRLHAKVVIAGSGFCSVGSQNLTSAGVRNREVSVAVTDPEKIGLLLEELQPWMKASRPITVEMVAAVEAALPPLKKLFRTAERAAASVEEEVWREDELRRWESRRASKDVQSSIKRVKRNLKQKLFVDRNVPRELAVSFIRAATWWHTHSSGWPMQAPGHARRITGSNGDWKVHFGANYFLVGRAISRCSALIRQYVAEYEETGELSLERLSEGLKWRVRGAVATHNGDEYAGHYPLTGSHMMFGATSINVNQFSSYALRICELGDLVETIEHVHA